MKLWKNIIGITYIIHFLNLQSIECQKSSKNFTIFWEIPTSLCKNYGINFDSFLQSIPMEQNSEESEKSNKIVTFNNPQLLNNHLPEKMGDIPYVYLQINDVYKKVLNTFEGLGVLNYTSWQPIFRQNYGPLEHFYISSIAMERELYPLLNEDQTLELAEMRFEFATRTILINSIKNITKACPSAIWGLFDYPKCTNLPKQNLIDECDREIMEGNNKLSWLWELNIALFPSLFISVNGNLEKKQKFAEARLTEAKRISEKYDPPLKIYPYVALSYDDKELLISKPELVNVLKAIISIDADGLIIWGNKNDVNGQSKCEKLYKYCEKNFKSILKSFLESIQNKPE